MPQPPHNPGSSSGSISPAKTPTTDWLPPTVLGDFELRHEIGRGGMGTVYEAWQRSLQRIVALKVLDRQVSASQVAVARFQREAQAAAKLNHPHIVPIYAQGSEGGVHFYAMELVDGQSVGAMIARTRECQGSDTEAITSPSTIAVSPAASGADRAAETMILSRPSSGVFLADTETEVKPPPPPTAVRLSAEYFAAVAEHIANVAGALEYAHRQGVIHRDIKPHNLLMGRDGRLRISDFGLARLAEQPGVTMTGELIGSPLYMSPEQIRGEPGEVGRRTDIYSLGATLYEWLALVPPYPADTRERVISQILSSEPPSLRIHNDQIPTDLETICAKALERNQSRRYQAAAELQDDLRRFLARRPIKAKRAGIFLRSARGIGRHQVAALSVIAALVAIVLGSALYRKQGQVRSQAEAAAQAVDQNAAILDALSATLPLELSALLMGAQAVTGAVDPKQFPLGMNRATGGSPGTDELLSVATPAAIGRQLIREFYSAVTPPDWPGSAVAKDQTAAILRKADQEWRDGNLQDALDLLDAYLANRPNDWAARRMHAAVCAEIGAFDKMLEDAALMVRLESQSVEAYIWRGAAQLLHGDLESSVSSLHWLAQLDQSPPLAKALYGLALIGQGRALGAVDYFDEALRQAPDLILAILGRASAYFADGSFAEAIADCDRVLQRSPQSADALTIRGDAHAALADYASAARDYLAAIDVSGRSAALGLRYLSVLVKQQQLAKAKEAAAKKSPAEVQSAPPKKSDDDAEVGPLLEWLSRQGRPKSNPKESSKASPGANLPWPAGNR